MSRTTTLEQEILEIINTAVKGKYLGKLKVNIDNVDGEDYYTLLLHMNQEQAPMHIGCPGPEEAFKEFIYEEMRRRKLHLIRRWEGFKRLPEDDECHSTRAYTHEDGSYEDVCIQCDCNCGPNCTCSCHDE